MADLGRGSIRLYSTTKGAERVEAVDCEAPVVVRLVRATSQARGIAAPSLRQRCRGMPSERG